MQDMEGEKIGILTVNYDHHETGVIKDLSEIQNKFKKYINSVIHVPMTKKERLDIIIVKGDVNEIKKLTGCIMKLKGIDHVKLTSIRIDS